MGHGSHFGCQKKQRFRKYLRNYSTSFPDCFCAPQKSFKDIFRNVPNWKNRIFFYVKNFEQFFFSAISCQKKQRFRKYLRNQSTRFPDCFCAPQKSFKDIFRNVPNWKNRKNFYVKNFEQFFCQRFLDFLRSVVGVIWSILQRSVVLQQWCFGRYFTIIDYFLILLSLYEIRAKVQIEYVFQSAK